MEERGAQRLTSCLFDQHANACWSQILVVSTPAELHPTWWENRDVPDRPLIISSEIITESGKPESLCNEYESSSRYCTCVCDVDFFIYPNSALSGKEEKIKYCINATPQFGLSPTKWKVGLKNEQRGGVGGGKSFLISSSSMFKKHVILACYVKDTRRALPVPAIATREARRSFSRKGRKSFMGQIH